MNTRATLVLAAGVSGAVSWLAWAGTGPDLMTCFIGGTSPETGFLNYGASNGRRAYAVLTVACNQGDEGVRWEAASNRHPVMTQNMFRLRNGRIEQIGQSWLKHGYSATQIDWCTTCQGGGNDQLLGPGCCDPYGVYANGSQSVGPKSEINPSTGYFPYPFCSPGQGGLSCPPAEPVIGRRLQVKQSDLDTSPNVQYFIEVQYLTADDAQLASPRTDFNNASYRPVSIDSDGDLAAWTGPIVHHQPAIFAWKAHGLGPNTPDPDVQLTSVMVPNDGLFWVAAKATDRGSGWWEYEYAVQNLNSDRAAGAFRVPLPTGSTVSVSNIGFHDVDYHSGEPYSLTDWPAVVNAGSIRWATTPFAQNAYANALRWGTLYNFRFRANRPPIQGNVQLELFKPGAPSSMTVSVVVPGPLPCAADIAPSGGDGTVNIDDLLHVIANWGAAGTNAADVNGDGGVNVDDLLAVISNWGPCE